MLQLLHALINLSDISKKLGSGKIDRTLDTKAHILFRKLMQKKIDELGNASSAISVNEIHDNFGAEDDAWWIIVFSHIKNDTNAVHLFQELLHKLKKTIPFEFMNLKQGFVDV